MENQEIRTLKLLEEIDNDRTPTQRDLSKKLNISLGLVNLFIKRLGKKGYFKVKTIPKNRVKYILTPAGAMEKTRLIYEYISSSYHYFKAAKNRVDDLYLNLPGRKAVQGLGFGVGVVPKIVLDNSPLGSQVRIVDAQPSLAPYEVGLFALEKRLASPLIRAFWSQLK